MPAQITIPDDANALAASQAAAAGFASIDEYLADLIRRQDRSRSTEQGAPAVAPQVGRLVREATGLIVLPTGTSERDVLTDALIEKHGL